MSGHWYLEMLPEEGFTKDPSGHIKLYKKGSKAPDYSGIAAANEAAAKYAKESADAQLAFDKQQYEDNQPYIKAAEENDLNIANAQMQAMNDSNARASDQWDSYKTTFQPIEQQMAQEAMDAGGAADQEAVAGRAGADVAQQSALASDAMSRRLEAMGINPNSGNFAAMSNANSLRTAATGAGAETNARTSAKDKGISLRAGAAAFGRNQTNTAGQMVGVGSNAGNTGVAAGTAGANVSLPSANLLSSGYGAQQNAAQMSIQSQLGLGNLMNQGSQISQSAGSGTGSMIGAGITAAATMY